MLPLVRAHVDLEVGGGDEGVRGGGHRIRVAGEGEDRAVVIDVAGLIEEPNAGDVADGLRQSVDRVAAPAFADVRHTLDQPRHGRSVIPHPWGLSRYQRIARLTACKWIGTRKASASRCCSSTRHRSYYLTPTVASARSTGTPSASSRPRRPIRPAREKHTLSASRLH